MAFDSVRSLGFKRFHKILRSFTNFFTKHTVSKMLTLGEDICMKGLKTDQMNERFLKVLKNEGN